MTKPAYRTFLRALREAALICDGTGTVHELNDRAKRLLGTDGTEERNLRGLAEGARADLSEWLAIACATSGPVPVQLRIGDPAVGEDSVYHAEASLLEPSPDRADCTLLVRIEHSDARHARFLELNRRIDDLHQRLHDSRSAERRFRQEATTDFLTRVLNRRGFLGAMKDNLAEPAGRGGTGAVVLLDIDRFKDINDRHGHTVGDLVLASVARVICESVRKIDVVGRMGGDEFSIFLRGDSEEPLLSTAERIRSTIQTARLGLDFEDVFYTVSVGIHLFDATAESGPLDELLAIADGALYEAKRAGRNTVCRATDDTRQNTPAT